MLPLGRRIEARREILDHLDIRRQCCTGEDTLEQIVAQHGVLGHPARKGGHERIDVIDALTRERPLAEQVLVDVGNRCGIGLDPTGTGIKPLVERPVGTDRQGRGHARLQDAVAFDDPATGLVQPRGVHRMRHLADQGAQAVTRQPGVGVQRDDKTDIRGNPVRAGDKGGVGGTAQQPVQLIQLAALAFPADPAPLGCIPRPAAMQKQKAVSLRHGIGLVQPCHGRDRRCDQLIVQWRLLGLCVRPVRQQRKMHFAADAGQMMHLQLLDLGQKIRRIDKQDRHRNQGAQLAWHAPRQPHPGQEVRCDRAVRTMVDQRHRQFAGGQHPEQGQHGQAPTPRTTCRQSRPKHKQRNPADHPYIAAQAPVRGRAERPAPQRGAVAHRRLQRCPPLADQGMAGVAFPVAVACGHQRECGVRYRKFIARRPARQILDRGAIAVARGEIHRTEV